MRKLGVVVIGRNEGARLIRCLRSVADGVQVVYVDSGSTDGSVEAARGLNAAVVELDTARPFTAARARNAGFTRLLELRPDAELVQFLDGDCELHSEWLATAASEIQQRPEVAVVCGRRRERCPQHSIYNRLCDLEWDTPIGVARSCGGDALMRVASLRAVGGYNPDLIAGEEPELCVRLRAAQWTILRIDAEMTLHDAAMTRWQQWWRRAVRAGHAYAEVSALHGRAGPRRQVRSNAFWATLPILGIVTALLAATVSSLGACAILGLVIAAYLVLSARVYRHRRRRGATPERARLYALFTVLAKFPMALGQLRYHINRATGRRQMLIEYKAAERTLRLAYLVNQYPHVSHSFIRREIRALEELGTPVMRISVRRSEAKLVDPADIEEHAQTLILLESGYAALAWSCVVALGKPLRLLRALRVTWSYGRRSGRLLKSPAYLAEACLLVRRLRGAGITHLHVHFGTNSADVAVITRVLGGPPFSFTVHGPKEFDSPQALSLADKFARSAFTVAISSFGRSQLMRWAAAADWPRIQVVRCGVDAAFLDGLAPPVGGSVLVCVGRLVEQKGQLLLIEAAARLARSGVDFQLVLAGDGPMRSRIEAAIHAGELQSRVRITGWISNDTVRQEIIASRLMVLPSFAEGLPVVLMEALALGRPVVTTYVAGIPELVRDGVNGWLVPPGSVEALEATLREALSADSDRLAAMGIAGAEAVRAAHNARTEAARLLSYFREFSTGSDA